MNKFQYTSAKELGLTQEEIDFLQSNLNYSCYITDDECNNIIESIFYQVGLEQLIESLEEELAEDNLKETQKDLNFANNILQKMVKENINFLTI